jgi:hypothetical protein
LAERLLGRKLHEHEQDSIAKAYSELLGGERHDLDVHFQVSKVNDPLHTELWRAKNRKVSKRLSYIISRFKLAIRYHRKPLKQPEPYFVESEQCSPERQAAWEANRRHSRLPCPPTKRRIYFEQMPGIEMFEWEIRRGVPLTVEDIMKTGGARLTKTRAEGALAWLKAKSDQSSEPAPEPQ